jgi:hypothetical protein
MAPVPLPSSFAEVTDQVEAVDGVRFGQLVTQITDQPGDQLITETLQLAREHITDVEAAEQALIDDWEPRIAAVVAAAEGDPMSPRHLSLCSLSGPTPRIGRR